MYAGVQICSSVRFSDATPGGALTDIGLVDRRQLMHRARALRRASTPAERMLWEVLRDRRCLGLKFRRQVPFRGFILDFFCRELSLAVELDGSVHGDPLVRAHDADRDELLRACGLRVLRIQNDEVTPRRLECLLKDVPPLRVCGEGDRG